MVLFDAPRFCHLPCASHAHGNEQNTTSFAYFKDRTHLDDFLNPMKFVGQTSGNCMDLLLPA